MREEQHKPEPLDYHKPDPSERRAAIHVLVGAVIGGVIVGGCVFVATFFGITSALAQQSPAWMPYALFGGIILFGIGVVSFWAWRARRSSRWRALGLGLWLGLALGLLGAGICFGVMR